MKVEKSWKIPNWFPSPKDVYDKDGQMVKVDNVYHDHQGRWMIQWHIMNVVRDWPHPGDIKSMELFRFLRYVDKPIVRHGHNCEVEKPEKANRRMIRLEKEK